MINTKQIFSQPRVTQAALGISIDEFNVKEGHVKDGQVPFLGRRNKNGT